MRETTEIKQIIKVGNKLGESPVWSAREARLYWVDSRGPMVFRYDPAKRSIEARSLPSIVGSICLRAKGGLVLALQDGLNFYDFETDTLNPIVDPEPNLSDNRLNDGRCDPAGRFIVGSMSDANRTPEGSLYALDPDLSLRKLRDGVIVPNSLAWSPDGSVMYFADTYRDVILAYDYDVATGTISGERVFHDTSGVSGRPDGSCVDREGCLWNAMFGGGRIVRYQPDGSVDREIELPVSQPSSCTFGGPGLETLFVTSATQRLSPDSHKTEPLAGNLFALDVGARGYPEPEFAG